jgi:hypothetical protein
MLQLAGVSSEDGHSPVVRQEHVLIPLFHHFERDLVLEVVELALLGVPNDGLALVGEVVFHARY